MNYRQLRCGGSRNGILASARQMMAKIYIFFENQTVTTYESDLKVLYDIILLYFNKHERLYNFIYLTAYILVFKS